MAKKKKAATRRKKKAAAAELPEHSAFLAQSGAVVLILAAVLLLLGGFGTGGPLPVNMFKGVYWALGWAAYITPVALTYWGVYKFKAEDGHIPLPNLAGMLAVLLFSSAWAYTAFATKNMAGVWGGGHGGSVGRVFGDIVLNALDRTPAAIIFFVFALLSILFAFSIKPKDLAKLADLFKRPEGEESELAALKAKAAESETSN